MLTQDGFPFQFDSTACAACGGRCCRGTGGYVWVSWEEIEAMAAARGMNAGLFAKQYARRVQGKLSLQERVINGEHLCCFFDRIECRCTMYENRPEQCRTFPFWQQYQEDCRELLQECIGCTHNTPK